MQVSSTGKPVRRSYRTDLPKGIRNKIKKLNAHEKRIIELQNTIIGLETQHGIVNTKFPLYQILPNCITNINQLPSDILIIIFELALRGCHPDINRLLRVSRRWHDLILDTPSLWARIELITRKEEHGKITLPDESYVQACHVRSANAPLRIFLDYRNLPSRYISEQQQMNRLLHLLRAEGADVSLLTELWEKRRMHDDDFDEPAWYSTTRSPAHSTLFHRAQALVEELATDDGEHMERWIEASFFGPLNVDHESEDAWSHDSDELHPTRELLSSLEWPTPNLVKLHLSGGVPLPLLDEDAEQELQLEELDITDEHFREVNLLTGTLWETLQRLHLRNVNCRCGLMPLRYLEFLEELTINSCTLYYHDEPGSILTFLFPHLKRLTFLDVGHMVHLIRFISPTLEELYVRTTSEMPALLIPTQLLIWEYARDSSEQKIETLSGAKAPEAVWKTLNSAFEWLGQAHGLVIYGVSEKVISAYLEDEEIPETLDVVQTQCRDGRFQNLFSRVSE